MNHLMCFGIDKNYMKQIYKQWIDLKIIICILKLKTDLKEYKKFIGVSQVFFKTTFPNFPISLVKKFVFFDIFGAYFWHFWTNFLGHIQDIVKMSPDIRICPSVNILPNIYCIFLACLQKTICYIFVISFWHLFMCFPSLLLYICHIFASFSWPLSDTLIDYFTIYSSYLSWINTTLFFSIFVDYFSHILGQSLFFWIFLVLSFCFLWFHFCNLLTFFCCC